MVRRAAIVGAAAILALIRLPPSLVERAYSARIYAGTQPLISTAVTGTSRMTVTPGQGAVFYDGDLVLGGGWIE